MDVDPSLQIQNKPSNNWQTNTNWGRYNNNYYQNNNRSNYYRKNQAREKTQAQKGEPEGTVNQLANKVTILNNINEDHFLDQTPTGGKKEQNILIGTGATPLRREFLRVKINFQFTKKYPQFMGIQQLNIITI